MSYQRWSGWWTGSHGSQRRYQSSSHRHTWLWGSVLQVAAMMEVAMLMGELAAVVVLLAAARTVTPLRQ